MTLLSLVLAFQLGLVVGGIAAAWLLLSPLVVRGEGGRGGEVDPDDDDGPADHPGLPRVDRHD